MQALEIVEPLYRLRVRRVALTCRVLALMDTSGSMYERIAGRAPETEEQAQRAIDYAFSVVLSLLRELLLHSCDELDGYIGFFSDKRGDFIYGGPLRDALLSPAYGGEDYYSLRGLDVGTVTAALGR